MTKLAWVGCPVVVGKVTTVLLTPDSLESTPCKIAEYLLLIVRRVGIVGVHISYSFRAFSFDFLFHDQKHLIGLIKFFVSHQIECFIERVLLKGCALRCLLMDALIATKVFLGYI